MGRLKRLSGATVCRILMQHGFTEVRRKGSHIVMQRRTVNGTCTVPVPDHPELKPGTLSAIIRQSDIPRSEFEVVQPVTGDDPVERPPSNAFIPPEPVSVPSFRGSVTELLSEERADS